MSDIKKPLERNPFNIKARKERIVRYVREPRYAVNFDLLALARPYGMKFYNFNLKVKSLSRSGMLLASGSREFIPFQLNTKINVTLDVTCAHFERPIHLVVKIVRLIAKDEVQEFGVVIEFIDPNHQKMYYDRIEALPLQD